MDSSVWLEAYRGGQWQPFYARNNVPRLGRAPLACGRDAADVAITSTCGQKRSKTFRAAKDAAGAAASPAPARTRVTGAGARGG
ncbi:hypothetical protein [Sorangium sp. So ce341]|uniref:hypothetical protein n=1 Tax=Sorangium sp. So ce341 TaxID=3133302 RepID=UPI003F6445DD